MKILDQMIDEITNDLNEKIGDKKQESYLKNRVLPALIELNDYLIQFPQSGTYHLKIEIIKSMLTQFIYDLNKIDEQNELLSIDSTEDQIFARNYLELKISKIYPGNHKVAEEKIQNIIMNLKSEERIKGSGRLFLYETLKEQLNNCRTGGEITYVYSTLKLYLNQKNKD